VVERGAIVPVVGIPLTYLKRFLGDKLSPGDLIDIFHEIGISVDGLETVRKTECLHCKEITECVPDAIPGQCDNCHREFAKEGADYKDLGLIDMFKLELLANRPDNFDAAGIARSVKGYLGIETGLVTYSAEKSEYEVTVDPNLSESGSYRPCIACAVVTGVSFDDDTVKSIMKLQENLHWALGRNRKFGAIGMYDLDAIGKKISYCAVADDEISFVPLACGGSKIDTKLSPRQILDLHPKGKAFAHLLKGFARFPLLIDDRGTVLSMPPIINSENTRVTKDTRKLFIDVTGLNMDTTGKMLNIIVTSLKDSMQECKIKTVAVHYPDKKTVNTPGLACEIFKLDYSHCSDILGYRLDAGQVIDCLKRMRFDARDTGDFCEVIAPCYRSDIRHEQDLIEDAAIAFGYKNLIPRKLEALTIGSILPVEAMKQNIREAMVSMGFLEIMSIMLTSEQREFVKLGLPVPVGRVIINNPISTDQTIVRTGLTAGIMEIIAANTGNELPQFLFETGETARVDEIGKVVENVLLCAGMVDSKVGFSNVKAVLKNMMHETGVEWKLEAKDLPFYLPGRAGSIWVKDKVVGHIGEIHPQVLDNFKISSPVALFELNLSEIGIIS
jgi:phenylalanyl-tRNA synthetase beta chain